jgi:N-methylhydantoinase A
MTYRLGVDVGGTFTDVLLVEESSGATWRAKTASTPTDQAVGVLNGIGKVCADAGIELREIDQVLHGTTVATNAILEGKGATVGLVTTKGFRQVLQIARSYVPAGWPAGSSGPSPSRWPRWRTPSRSTSGWPATAPVIRELDEGRRARPAREADRAAASRRSPCR